MTEAEWLACEEPGPMLKRLRRKASARKLRLWACACCRYIAYLMVEEGERAIETVERYADGEATLEDLAITRQAIEPYIGGEGAEEVLSPLTSANVAVAVEGVLWGVSVHSASAVEVSIEASGPDSESFFGTPDQARAEANRHCVAVLREIFGNPFRPVVADPRWLTPNVVDLARTIYDERAFERLPILADALMDAGCDSADILAHCRSEGPHARGCWVVDLILGKS